MNNNENEVEQMKLFDEVLVQFKKDWLSIPPLVRAGHASSLYMNEKNGMINETNLAKSFFNLGFERRSMVRNQFGLCALFLGDFFKALTLHADSEAEAKGIDLDIKSDFSLAETKEEVRKYEVIDNKWKEDEK